jgi:growth factor-regulated tyrosine kinase substrate
MFRSSSSFDRLLEKATSHLLLEPDWDSILCICDTIRYIIRSRISLVS